MESSTSADRRPYRMAPSLRPVTNTLGMAGGGEDSKKLLLKCRP